MKRPYQKPTLVKRDQLPLRVAVEESLHVYEPPKV